MSKRTARWIGLLVFLGISYLASASDHAPEGFSEERLSLDVDGQELRYHLLAPAGHDAEQPAPVLLILPPAEGARRDVLDVLDAYFRDAAMARGWVIVAAEAPYDAATRYRTPFYLGAEGTIPPLLDAVGDQLAVEGGRFHVAGVSTGGVGAFRVATLNPDRFASVLVLPGTAREPDLERIDVLTEIPVRMYAGEHETEQELASMRDVVSALDGAGGSVELILVPGDEHKLTSVTGNELFDWLDAQRP